MLRFFTLFSLIGFLGLPASAMAGTPGAAPAQVVTYDEGAPDFEYVYVPGSQFEGGSAEQGFYRRKARVGFVWVPAAFAPNGDWVRGHWRPATTRADHVWVRGHVGSDGYWVPGHWRRASRPGYVWVATSRNDRNWRSGYWKPISARKGYVWVSGRRGLGGVWVAGHWRRAARQDHVWVPGYWKYGRWVRGHWRPRVSKASSVWVPGHWSYAKQRWIPGRWRTQTKAGHFWRRATYRNGVWVPAGWVRGARPVYKRVHPRVRPVRKMRTIHKPRLHRRGKTQRAVGKQQVRRGKAMKAVGRATGNKKLQKKGQRVKTRGQNNKKKGNRKIRRSRR